MMVEELLLLDFCLRTNIVKKSHLNAMNVRQRVNTNEEKIVSETVVDKKLKRIPSINLQRYRACTRRRI